MSKHCYWEENEAALQSASLGTLLWIPLHLDHLFDQLFKWLYVVHCNVPDIM